MRVRCKMNWCKKWQQGVRKGDLLLRPFGTNMKNLGEFFRKLDKWQNEKEELRELDVVFEVHYKKRTLDMNNLMWGLYEVIANELNNGKNWRDLLPEERDGYITTDQLYENDLKEHAPVFEIIIKKEQALWIRDEYRVLKEEPEGDDIRMYVCLSTSKMDTIQMSEWIDRLFRRLSNMGVHLEKGSDVATYWEEYIGSRDPAEVSGALYTAEQYKQLRPFCEATTEDLSNGGGSLAHIKARGMGRNPMEGKYLESEVMHLTDTAHALWDNGKGREHFIKQYPHLKAKIEYALNKQIADTEQELFTAEEVCEKMGTSVSEMADVQEQMEEDDRNIPLF